MSVMLKFYEDILGMTVTADNVEEFAQGKGLAPAKRRAVYLRWRDGPHDAFVVLDHQITNPASGGPVPLFHVGCHHFSFWVDNLEDIKVRILDLGVKIVIGNDGGPGADTSLYGEPPGGYVKSIIVQDPEGNHVQLNQRA